MRRVGEIHDVQEAADASEALGEVVRHTVRGEGAHVASAAWQVDAGLQDRVAAVGRSVINRKIRPVVLADHEEVAPSIGLQRLVRGKRRGSVVQVRARLWVLRVRGIDHRHAEVLLQRSNTVRSKVCAVTGVRRSILRKCSLTSVLAHEFQIAVVAEFGIAAETLLSCGLTLQSAFDPIPRTTMGFGHRSRKRVGEYGRSPEQQAQQASGYNRECPDYGKRFCTGHIRFSFPALLTRTAQQTRRKGYALLLA